METVLIVDADSVLGRALCDELSRQDYRVLAHVRTKSSVDFGQGVTVVAPRADESMAAWSESVAPISHIVFDQPRYDDDDFEQLVTSVEDRLGGFLAELQAAGKLLARGNGGQIWVLTQEDSMHYYADIPSLPIDTRARHAAVKSYAKELFRFGVRINCAHVQPLEEQAPPQEWQRARDGLKAYAMKFKPNRAAAAAQTLRHFLAQRNLPIAGMVVPIGIGFAEQSI